MYDTSIAKIIICKSATNFIVTVTDLFGKVLYGCTSFSSLYENAKDKRRRLSIFAIKDIALKIMPVLLTYDVYHLILICRIKSSFVLQAMHTHLTSHTFKIYGSIREFINPHNGVKAKKQKRR